MNISLNEVYSFLFCEEQKLSTSEADRRERDRYLCSSGGRIWDSLRYLPDRPNMRLLEIGSVPYYASTAFIHFLRLDPGHFVMVDGPKVCDDRIQHEYKEISGQRYDRFIFNAEQQIFPFPDESFDTVICVDVLEHLLFDPVFLVQQCNRVLKTGGTLLLSTSPAVFCWDVALRHLFNLNVEMGYNLRVKNPYERHNRLFSLREVRQMAALNGFQVKRAFTRSHPYRVDRWMSRRSRVSKRFIHGLDKITEYCAPALPFLREKAGSQIWVIAEKQAYQEQIVYPPTLNLHSNFESAP